MPRQRKTLCAEDLTSAALVQGPSGKIYRLGPPSKKNVNLNVVNHCQLFYRSGKPAGQQWFNLSNLREAGFKLYRPIPGQLVLRSTTQEGTQGEMIAIRSYEFEGGILHLELDAVQNMPNDEVAELYGSGELLAVRDGEMPAKQFFALEDFRDL